jgi:hypothetical protein
MTSPDKGPNKVTQPTSLNRYTYGNLDPINHNDPSGNTPQTVGSVMECDFAGGNVTAIYLFGTAFPNDAYYGGYQYSYFVTGYECDVPDPVKPDNGTDGGTNVEVGGGQDLNIILQPSPVMSFSEKLALAYVRASEALSRPSCAGLFNTSRRGEAPTVLLADLYNGVGGSIRPGTFRTTYLRGQDVTPRATMTIESTYQTNAAGQRVYQGMVPVITINTNMQFNSAELAAILLHELGHVYGLAGYGGSRIVPDNNTTMQGVADSRANRELIANNCRF